MSLVRFRDAAPLKITVNTVIFTCEPCLGVFFLSGLVRADGAIFLQRYLKQVIACFLARCLNGANSMIFLGKTVLKLIQICRYFLF